MITTATIWVCGKCGTVSHLDGTVQPDKTIHGYCPNESGKHSLKPVLVMVPWT